MARRPLLPERATFALSLVGSLVAWLGATRAADALGLPDMPATAAGVVVGLVALVALPTLLGRPESGVMLLSVVGGMAIVIGFISRLDDIGLGSALAIFVPAVVVLVGLVLLARRFLVPSQRAGHRG